MRRWPTITTIDGIWRLILSLLACYVSSAQLVETQEVIVHASNRIILLLNCNILSPSISTPLTSFRHQHPVDSNTPISTARTVAVNTIDFLFSTFLLASSSTSTFHRHYILTPIAKTVYIKPNTYPYLLINAPILSLTSHQRPYAH